MKTRCILALVAFTLTLGVLQTAPAAAGDSCLSFCARDLADGGFGLDGGVGRNICRNPCGGTCNSGGLACDFNTNTCRVCGFLGTFCCPFAPQCSEGTCKAPGTCQ
jgi:hypothetical protein